MAGRRRGGGRGHHNRGSNNVDVRKEVASAGWEGEESRVPFKSEDQDFAQKLKSEIMNDVYQIIDDLCSVEVMSYLERLFFVAKFDFYPLPSDFLGLLLTLLKASGSEMNTHISERLRGNGRPQDSQALTFSSKADEVKLNVDIREYFRLEDTVKRSASRKSSQWLQQPEIPTGGEILLEDDEEVSLPPNKIDGPWKSKERYLKSHYTLLREDAVSPLRDAVDTFRQNPEMDEDGRIVSIYEKVHITGFKFAPQGIATRIKFSTTRVGKGIAWRFSKRLVAGTIVALTPAKDKFQTKCIVAIVAARPLAAVEETPPEIDIYFSCTDEIEIDPQLEWTMLEAKQGYYEASRHTLKALQKLGNESFPLSEQICTLSTHIEAPKYLLSNPNIDLRSAFIGDDQQYAMQNVNILRSWPPAPEQALDSTQWSAMRQILTNRLSIIQGPPGTGKTHVSKKALQILLENRKAGDPPIIIAAQTNHALDQLLGHVAKFDPDYIRLGGRTTNADVKKRALHEVRQREHLPPPPGGLLGKANKQQPVLAQEMIEILSPLNRGESRSPFTVQTFHELGILTETQKDLFVAELDRWVGDGQTPMQLWANDKLEPFQVVYKQDNFGLDEEEVDLEFEQVTELQAEKGITDEEDAENLSGPWCSVDDRWTFTRSSRSVRDMVERLLASKINLWEVKENLRGPMYGIMQEKAKAVILRQFREHAKTYERITRDVKVGRWERDATYLQRANFIGMTTTGLSKYRGLISSLKPRIILIEEAAEVIEAPVTAACVESLEHLILVGDHQQLQGHCNVKELGVEPYNLNVSMFERLVNNNMPFRTLLRQRRMDPEFRRLLHPIYPQLEDHPDVVNRPLLPVGLGTLKSFFFNHEYPEYKDSQLSTFNDREAEFIAGFYHYLIQNSASSEGITILTFYNGQRKRILSHLKSRKQISQHYTNVVTVDSYQGEENGIVILSLVRSNDHGQIGFLDVDNRVCVALSRAKYGFYIFGNGKLLAKSSTLWSKVIEIMGSNPNRVGDKFPIVCKKHNRKTLITYPGDWQNSNGGCDLRCSDTLPCGHPCPLKCHEYPHDMMTCQQTCHLTLTCGHKCAKVCSDKPCDCSCEEFAKNISPSSGKPSEDDGPSHDNRSLMTDTTGITTWSNVAAAAGKKQDGKGEWGTEVRSNNNQRGQKAPSQLQNVHPGGTLNFQDILDAHEATVGDISKSTIRGSAVLPSLPSLPGIESNTEGSGASLYTARSSHTFNSGFENRSQHSPEKQSQSRGDWTTYAAGGVKKDDSKREKYAAEEMRLAIKSRAAEASLIDFGDESPVKPEKIVEMKNGRKKFTEMYPIRTNAPGYRTPSISGDSASGQSSGQQSLIDLMD